MTSCKLSINSPSSSNTEHYLNRLNSIKKDKGRFIDMVDALYRNDGPVTIERTYSGRYITQHRSPVITSPVGISRSGSILYRSDSTFTNGAPSGDFARDSFHSMIKWSGDLPSNSFKGYHHATWYVSNAKQTASYFITCFGFTHIAFRGLETGSKLVASHVVKNGNVVFEFLSPIVAKSDNPLEMKYLNGIFDFIRRHGDGVKDVSFEVVDVDLVFNHAIRSGARPIYPPRTLEDSFGRLKSATIEVFDDVHHTLIQRDDYRGVFLPGYTSVQGNELYDLVDACSIKMLPPITLSKIDHCVQNENWNTLEAACDVYSKIFGFHKYWSVDENDISTEYSALRSIVMASGNEEIKMPINEPAEGICKSQIEEFLDFYNGPGVQHIAVLTENIIQTVSNMKSRGAEFIKVPNLYYENLLPRLMKTGVQIKEDLNELEKLGILLDFDEKGYLLQIFTKPITDRPTFFLEIIQRHNHNGFGKGNFKSLFETIEAEQRRRGTLEK